MADLGNLKILLDMATTGNLKSTLENVDNRLDKMREKASSLHLGFDDKSISALSTKIYDIVGALSEINRNAGTKLAEGMRESVSSSDQLLKVTKELEAAEARLASSKERSAHLEEERIRRNEKLADVQRSILKSQEEAELYNLRHKTGIESKDIETLTKYLDLIKELKKLTPWNKGTGSETWAATTEETVAIVDRLAKKWNIAREEVEKYFHTFQSYSGHRYDFSFDDKMGLYNLSLSQRTNEFSPGSDEKLKAYKESARAAKDAVKELADEEEHLHHALDETRQKLTSENAKVKEESAEVKRLSEAKKELSKTEGQSSVGAQKEITSEIKQQVALSADLEALFKEMAGTIRSIEENQGRVTTSTKASAAATKEATQEEQKRYDITMLRRGAEEKDAQLEKDEVAILKQMEAIEKALIDIDQKHSTHLADNLQKWMHYNGVTKEQLGVYQALITRMQAAQKMEEKATREAEKASQGQKKAAKEREAAAKRQAQLETTIVRIETQLLGVNEARLSTETQILVAKMRSGQITQEEAGRLSALLAQHRAIENAERRKADVVEKTNMHFGRQSGILQQINSYLATYVSVLGAVNLIKNLVRITGEFEAQHVALRAILQDVAGADRIFYQLQELAVKSPFTFRNLTDYAKQLSAFSVPMSEIYDTTKRLADVSAGLGVDMSRIILAYGQIRSASFLRGQEVRQLTEAGIPVLQELAKQFSEIEGRMISAGEVFDRISARQVPFEMIEKMFKDLTSAGGKFYQMQEVLAETVKGKISNLQDAWEIMLSRIGDANSGTIKKAISTITEMLQNYETLIPTLKAIALSLVTMKSVVGVVNTIQKIRIALINQETRALLIQKVAINSIAAALGIGVGVVTYFIQKQKQARAEALELSRAMDQMGEDFRKTFSSFAVAWQGVERAYERIAKERHDAFQGAQLLPNTTEESKRLIEYSNRVVGPLETIHRKVKEIASDESILFGVSEETRRLIDNMNRVVGPIETIRRDVKEISTDAALLTNTNEETRKLAENINKVVGPVETIRRQIASLPIYGGELEASMVSAERKVKRLVSDGGELEAAIVSISNETKRLVSDGGEIEASIISVDRNVKQLTSDGGELEASVVSAAGKAIPSLNAAIENTVKTTKELSLVGKPVVKSQEEIEKQFNASQKSTEEYEAALNELYEKYPNFIDENVRQKIAVEDLAGAWDLATMNMRQYYAEQASQQAHSILRKGYDKQVNDIIEKLNLELRSGKDYKTFRDNGLINEGAIQLIDAYVMGVLSEQDLDSGLRDLVKKINSVGAGLTVGIDTKGETPVYGETPGKSLIDNARRDYESATDAFNKSIKSSDKTIEDTFTSTKHKDVMEYLANAGLSDNSILAMKNDESGFETWQQWQDRLREEYKKTGEENREAIEKMFSHFGLVVNPNELTSTQQHVADWMNSHPATGVSLPGLTIKPETNISEFAETALKMMQDDAKDLARLPKEFQKTEEQTWEEYAEMLEDMGDDAHAMVARRIEYLGEMSQALWGDDVFGSQKELLKKQKQRDEDYRQYVQDQLAALRQQFQDLKEIKGWYDKLRKIGMSDADTRRFLSSFNMGVPEKGFNVAFDNLSKEFVKYGDKNSAQDVQNYKNGRDINSTLDSAKAIEKYTEALKGLEAQTKRLNLTGFAQDLDKIIVDADSKNRQLETNWAQKAEELEKAKSGWIQRYRIENEKATAEDAEKAWSKFYDDQVAMAKKSIDTQREYNNKVAQEQINDKANKWLEEMMKENNINLNDMGDKSLEQVNTLISRLEQLASEETLAGLIPAELKEDAALINVEFSKLLSTIKKIANTKLGDLSVEKMKKTLNGVKAIANTLGINTDTSAVESSYSTYLQALVEVANAQKDVNVAQAKFDDAKATNDMDAKAAAYRELAVAQGILAKKTEDAADAQKQYNAAIAMAGVGAFASAMGKVASKMKEYADATNDANLSDTAEVMGAVAQNLNAAAQGYAAAASAGAGAYAWIGAVIGGVSDLILQIVDASAKAEKFNAQMRKAEMSWALSIAAVRNEYELLQERMNTIFGTSTISKMSGWINLINKQRKAIYDFNNYVYRSGDASSRGGNGRDRGGASHSSISSFIGTDVQRLAKYQVEIRKGLRQSLIDVVPELFKENGEINFDYLDTFKASEFYNQLDDSMKNLVDKMLEANNTIKEAMKNMADYLTSVFGQVGADISNSLITAFEQTGEVALDTGEILSQVAKKFVDDWTQAFLMKNYLSDLSDTINDIWMDSSLSMEEQVSQSLGLFRDSLTAMSDRLPEIQAFYEGMEDQSHWADGAGEEIGDAIKTAMVEQNSSLIAGYINSMRADLSMQRNEIMRNISPAVTSISNGFNTHLQYMESVAGNVQNIWERLNLLTSSGSGVKLNARI